MFCSRCGENQVDAPTFCRGCGEKLVAPAIKQAAVPAPHSAVRHQANARVIDARAAVYRDMDVQSPLVTELTAGDEVSIGTSTKRKGKQWVEVKLRDGRHGHMLGDTKIYAYTKASLLEKEVTAYEQPSPLSAPKLRYKKGAVFHIIDNVKGNTDWVKIRDLSGNEGFIDEKTRIKNLTPDKDEGDGKGDMLWGAIWCIGGILLSATTTFIFFGAIIFGGYQFLKGLLRYIGHENELAKGN